MSTNTTSEGGKRPWNQVFLAGLFTLSLVTSPITSVQAVEAATTLTGAVSSVTTSTQVTELPEEADMRSEIGEPAVLEVVTPASPEVLKVYSISMTAYNSEVGQTDASPFTTADGSTVRDGILAANFLPFGTKVRVPSLFGDRVFEVHDRMNPRYTLRADVWMSSKTDALQFGLKRNVKIEVIEWGDNRKTQWKRIAQENALKRVARAAQ